MRVLIFKYGEIKYTETFIKSNIEKLPFQVEVLQKKPILVVGKQSPDLIIKVLFYLEKTASRFNPFLELKLRDIALYYLLKKIKPNIVLSQFGFSGAVIAKACKKTNIPLVVYFRGYDATAKHILDKHEKAYKLLFKNCKATISVSRSIRDKIISLGANPDTAFVAPSGANVPFFSRTSPLTKKKNLLFVGRFVPKKAPHLLLLAFAKVQAQHREAKLLMVGEGPLLDICKDLVDVLGLKKNVVFCGKKNHKQVKQLMTESRVYVQHSVTASNGDSEGTPVSILEAGASGLPVVSTKHAGITDAIIHGKTGYIVEEKDIELMADYIIKLLDEYELADQLGKIAQQHIKENFTQSETINRITQILEWITQSNISKPSLLPDWNHIYMDTESKYI